MKINRRSALGIDILLCCLKALISTRPSMVTASLQSRRFLWLCVDSQWSLMTPKGDCGHYLVIYKVLQPLPHANPQSPAASLRNEGTYWYPGDKDNGKHCCKTRRMATHVWAEPCPLTAILTTAQSTASPASKVTPTLQIASDLPPCLCVRGSVCLLGGGLFCCWFFFLFVFLNPKWGGIKECLCAQVSPVSPSRSGDHMQRFALFACCAGESQHIAIAK